jgi:hypothetical protein
MILSDFFASTLIEMRLHRNSALLREGALLPIVTNNNVTLVPYVMDLVCSGAARNFIFTVAGQYISGYSGGLPGVAF